MEKEKRAAELKARKASKKKRRLSGRNARLGETALAPDAAEAENEDEDDEGDDQDEADEPAVDANESPDGDLGSDAPPTVVLSCLGVGYKNFARPAAA